MSWLATTISPAPHVLDPVATEKAAYAFGSHQSSHDLRDAIARHQRAIAHEQAVLAGLIRAYDDWQAGRITLTDWATTIQQHARDLTRATLQARGRV